MSYLNGLIAAIPELFAIASTIGAMFWIVTLKDKRGQRK